MKRNRDVERTKVVTFLNEIGLGAVEGDFTHESFLDDVSIAGGTIVYKPTATASTILHEAGHLAVIPEQFRQFVVADADLDLCEHYDRWLETNRDPMNPMYFAIVQAGECEATAWSYAAALACGIDTMVPLEEGFDGNGRTIHAMLQANAHFGVKGLFHSGMCRELNERGHPVNTFPRMVRWLQA